MKRSRITSLLLLAVICGVLVSPTGCTPREPFPEGMSMETWFRIHHIQIKPAP